MSLYLGFTFPPGVAGDEREAVAVARVAFVPRYFVFSYAADVAHLANIRIGQTQQLPRDSGMPISVFDGRDHHHPAERARADELLLQYAGNMLDGFVPRRFGLALPRSYNRDCRLNLGAVGAGVTLGLTVRWPDGAAPVPFACIVIGDEQGGGMW